MVLIISSCQVMQSYGRIYFFFFPPPVIDSRSFHSSSDKFSQLGGWRIFLRFTLWNLDCKKSEWPIFLESKRSPDRDPQHNALWLLVNLSPDCVKNDRKGVPGNQGWFQRRQINMWQDLSLWRTYNVTAAHVGSLRLISFNSGQSF